LLATGLAVAGCSDDGSAPAEGAGEASGRAIPVVAMPVRFEAEANRVEAVGTSRALRSVELHAESAGEVVDVTFEGGEQVDADQVLVALDARDQVLAVELAEVALADARLLFQRYEEARAAEAVPPTTLDAARTALESARIELARARVALDHRFVHAPFAGMVGVTDVEPGDRIDPTTLITTVDDRSALLVFFDVPEAFVGKIEPGRAIEVETWTADRHRAAGPVVSLGSRIDPATRSFAVRARIPNENDRLRPGMSFRVLLELDGGVWPSVPEVALQWGANGPYVWAVREGTAERVDARVVQRRQGRILIEADLTADDHVVSEGVQRMRQGIPVRALDPEALARDARGVLSREAARQDSLAGEPTAGATGGR
jgi:RND family efflux transporter MFP subunit